MHLKYLLLPMVVVVALAIILLEKDQLPTGTIVPWPSAEGFSLHPLPVRFLQDLEDIGVADANADDLLDLFTTNHNYRQSLWISDGRGGFKDSVSAWGLDQSPQFPGLEVSLNDPEMDRPGVYIYWKERRHLIIRSEKWQGMGPLTGTLRSATGLISFESSGFIVEVSKAESGSNTPATETVVHFSAAGEGVLDLMIVSPGVPINVQLDKSVPVAQVYVGAYKVSPRSHEFELAFQDPHGMAWADYNDDGKMDVFVTRGAVGGTAESLPQSVRAKIRDQLLVSQPEGTRRDVASEVGIEKDGCSGRKVTWVDFDHDGLLDLFINCLDRGKVEGTYGKQLYRQDRTKHFSDVAGSAGLALPDHEVIDFAWLDVDGDGMTDLVTVESTGFFVYWNTAGRFSQQFIGRAKFVRADNPKLKGISTEYWFVDGKLSVADFDQDGSMDVFCSSKTGNVLLQNRGARSGFTVVDPASIGLPSNSASAVWVDYDNDGLIDLHAVPDGLFRQRRNHTFESTGALALPVRKYMAAIINWPDLDNDGSRDVVVALLENFAFWPWWKRLYKSGEDRFTWDLVAYRNARSRNHWLQVRVVGKPGNPQAIGARVTVRTPEGQQVQEVGATDGAFFSQGHYRLYFGLGPRDNVEELSIRWPDGRSQQISNVPGDRLLVIQRETPP
jgi:hypothetical protein